MAYTTINKSTDYFNTKLYTGNGSTQSITGVGFQPDWTWIKKRNAAVGHRITDAVRGATKTIFSDDTAVEATLSTALTAFTSDGFSLGSETGVNNNSDTYVSWNWKANGQGSSNTDGSTNTTYTSVNTTAGFSISTYAGTGSVATIGHGLGVAPKVVLIKCTSHSENWVMYHASQGAGKYIYFNTSDAAGPGSGSNTSIFNNTAPTNSVFTVNTDGVSNGSGKNYIAYCFAEKTGYSKFGSYTGNGNANGTFVYTGFKPAFLIIKRTDSGDNTMVHDNKREGYNPANDELMANLSNAEQAYDTIDLLSNGFKLRHSAGRSNNNNGNYIYMAFGQSLVGSNNVPCTAR